MERGWTTGLALLLGLTVAAGCGSATGDDDDADGDVPVEGLGDEFDVPPDGDVPPEDVGDEGPDGSCECASDEDCQDDSFCNGEEQCVACECRPGIALDNGTSCDDGDPCTDGETCTAGVCTGGASICLCDTDDDCAAYEDDDLCNGTLVCDPASHTCVVDPGTLVTCDPSGDTACRANRCDPGTGSCAMQPRGEGTSCDDGDACTLDDVCTAGVCGGAARDCGDGNVCTDDGCDPASGCTHTSNTAPCDDGDACTTPDVCSGGVCVGTGTGLTLCPDGACYDLQTDRDHCGDCTIACRFDEDCSDGHCLVRAWETVGRTAVHSTLPALAHALGSDGTTPHVAWVADEATDAAYVHRLGAVGWTQLGGSLNGGSTTQPVIDIQFEGARPYVFTMDQSMLMTPPDHVKTWDAAGTGWVEVGAPGYRPTCVMHFSAALALEGARPHFSFLGAGGCGIGVGYARWSGSEWWDTPNPPSPMGTGLLTMNGGGCTDVVWDGARALVALLDEGRRYVRYWDGTSTVPGAWVNLGPSFNQNPPPAGTAAANYLWMALDATGRVWVAFAEQDAGVQKVFVKRYDATAGAWVLIGGGPVSDPTRNSDYPSLAFVGGTPHVAWVEDVTFSGGPGAAGGVIRVVRWTGLAWERVGAPLNNDATADALLPYLVGIGTVPYVAFREPVAAPQRIWVKRFP